MGDQIACSPCSFEALLSLPSPGNELLSLGLPASSPQQQAPLPHAAQVQASAAQRTPEMASLNCPISEEEMEWLVALAEEDVAAPASCCGWAAAAPAEAASTSATATAPGQQDAQHMQLVDQRLLQSAPSEPGVSIPSPAAAAAEAANNAAWAADTTAASTGRYGTVTMSRREDSVRMQLT